MVVVVVVVVVAVGEISITYMNDSDVWES